MKEEILMATTTIVDDRRETVRILGVLLDGGKSVGPPSKPTEVIDLRSWEAATCEASGPRLSPPSAAV